MARRSRPARLACTRSRSRFPIRSPMATGPFRRASAAVCRPPGLSFPSPINKGNHDSATCRFLSDGIASRQVPRVSFAQPTIKKVAGGNSLAPLGDGGPAVNANIGGLTSSITVDSAGNLYLWDTQDSRIRKVNTAGIISSVTATIGQLKELVARRRPGDRQRRQPLHRRYPVLRGAQGGYVRSHDHHRGKRNTGLFRQ